MADRITICVGCRTADGAAPGAALAERLRVVLGARAEVRTTDCMIVCSRPVTVSFRAEGKAAYLFAGVDPEGQLDELVTFAGLYAAAADGIVTDARPCGELRFRLVGRLPA